MLHRKFLDEIELFTALCNNNLPDCPNDDHASDSEDDSFQNIVLIQIICKTTNLTINLGD